MVLSKVDKLFAIIVMYDKIVIMNKELLEKLYKARQEYKKIEEEVYSLIKENDLGTSYKLSKGITATVGENLSYKYSNDFIQYMKNLYVKERKKKTVTSKKSLYIKFS